MKNLILIVCSAAALFAGIHPLGWWLISLWAFLPLFYIYYDPEGTPKQTAFAADIVALLYYGVGLTWLLAFELTAYGLVLLTLFPCFPVYLVLLRWLCGGPRQTLTSVAGAAALWIAIQKLYSLTPIGTIGTEIPFYGPDAFFQAAAFVPYAAVAGLILSVNASLALYLRSRNRVHLKVFCILAGALVVLGLLGQIRSAVFTPQAGSKKIKAAMAQHNLPVETGGIVIHKDRNLEQMRLMAAEAAKALPDLIVFPLFDAGYDILRSPEIIGGLARDTGRHILIASYIPGLANDRSGASGFTDNAVLFSPDASIASVYQAVKPPPFAHPGEYKAPDYRIMDTVPFGKLGVLLCYEDSLYGVAKTAADKGAEILISLSNPGQFAATWMPYYHLVQTRMRAIESGRPVVRVSANGYSAVISASGRILQKTNLSQRQILQAGVQGAAGRTFRHRSPDFVSWGAIGWVLWLAVRRLLKKKPAAN